MLDSAVSFPTHDNEALLVLPLPVVPHRITLPVRDMDGELTQLIPLDKPDRVAQALKLRHFWQYLLTARAMEASRSQQVLAEDG